MKVCAGCGESTWYLWSGEFCSVSCRDRNNPPVGQDLQKPFNPAHYSTMKIEPIDVIEACDMNYNVASATAYAMRAGKKGDYMRDIKCALNFLHREIYGTWFTEPKETEK